MDNRRLDITDDTNLQAAMQIAFHGAAGGKATHYLVESASEGKPVRLLLFWNHDKRSDPTPFMFPVEFEDAADMVGKWLKEQDYGPQPDHDGDNGLGWRVYNESWGRVGDSSYAFVAIEPVWACYGK